MAGARSQYVSALQFELFHVCFFSQWNTVLCSLSCVQELYKISLQLVRKYDKEKKRHFFFLGEKAVVV